MSVFSKISITSPSVVAAWSRDSSVTSSSGTGAEFPPVKKFTIGEVISLRKVAIGPAPTIVWLIFCCSCCFFT